MNEKRYESVGANLECRNGREYMLVKRDDGFNVCQVCSKHTAKEIVDELNNLADENEQLKQENERYKRLSEIRNEQINNRILTIREFIDNCSNEDVKNALQDLFYSEVNEYDLAKENRILCSENERMTNKLNELALEFLNHEMISMGKAVEISEMSYHDFLKYRAEHGNPMELQL